MAKQNEVAKEEVVEKAPEASATVTLTQEQFDAMMNRMEKQSDDIAVLKKSVSKYKLEENEAAAKKGKIAAPRGHLKRLNGKLVVKWFSKDEEGSKAKSEIIYNGSTPVGESLKGHYVTLEGEDIVTDAIQYFRSTDLEYFTKVGQVDANTWVIKFDDPALPQEYKIDIKFINP